MKANDDGPCVLSSKHDALKEPEDIDQTDLHRSEPSLCTMLTDEHPDWETCFRIGL